MRYFVLAALFIVGTAGAAFADATVAGTWHANMGDDVIINMDMSPSGSWSSETLQHNTPVRQMKGTYTQKHSSDHSGVLVFTPVQAAVKTGKVQKETDRYELTNDGNQLKLTSSGDTMVFEKQPKP